MKWVLLLIALQSEPPVEIQTPGGYYSKLQCEQIADNMTTPKTKFRCAYRRPITEVKFQQLLYKFGKAFEEALSNTPIFKASEPIPYINYYGAL